MRIEALSTAHMSKAGLHVFEITVKSNDPVEPVRKLQIRGDFTSLE